MIYQQVVASLGGQTPLVIVAVAVAMPLCALTGNITVAVLVAIFGNRERGRRANRVLRDLLVVLTRGDRQ